MTDRDPLAMLPWWARDWRASGARATLTPMGRLAHLEMLFAAWLNPDCGLPCDPKALSALTALRQNDFTKCWSELRALWVEKDGRLYHERLLAEWQKAHQYRALYRERATKAATARWSRQDASSNALAMLASNAQACPASASATLPLPTATNGVANEPDKPARPRRPRAATAASPTGVAREIVDVAERYLATWNLAHDRKATLTGALVRAVDQAMRTGGYPAAALIVAAAMSGRDPWYGDRTPDLPLRWKGGPSGEGKRHLEDLLAEQRHGKGAPPHLKEHLRQQPDVIDYWASHREGGTDE